MNTLDNSAGDIQDHIHIELKDIDKNEDKINFSQDTFALAFQLISDASVGRITNFERTPNCLWFYRLYLSTIFRLIRIVFHLTLVILTIYDSSNRDCQSTLTKITVSIEVLYLSFYSLQLFIVYKFSKKEKFIRDKKHYISSISILVSAVDIILFMNHVYQFRISPAMRVFIFINSNEQSQIRRHLRTLRITILNVIVILPFLLTFYLMMVAFIYRYFKIHKAKSVEYFNGKPYMDNLLDIVWDTLVYITSANSPDVMLPALSRSNLMGILFPLFYAVIYFLLVFIYGIIMRHFRNHAKDEMRQLITSKMTLMYEAFILLTDKENINDGNENNSGVLKDIIKKTKWDLLIQRFSKYKNCKEAADLMYSLLCQSNKPYLTKNEFMKMADLIAAPLSMISSSLHFFERHLWFPFSNKFANFIESKYFTIFVAIIIVINWICITFSNEPYTELFFSILFLLEISSRIYVKGIFRYFRSTWNVFDFFVIISALIFWFIEQSLNIQTVTFTLLALRSLRLLKLLRGITRYHKLLHILGMLIPTISSLLILVFCFIVLYLCIGMWCYQGMLFKTHSESDYMFNSSDCNSTRLANSDFGRLHYCILSFNTFLSGFETLCAIAIGNNWHTISEGYELESSQVILSRLYFSIFKGIMTYLLLLIIAFVLDVFLLAHEDKSALQIEETITQKLESLNLKFISYKFIRESRKLKNEWAFSNSSSVFRYFKRVEFEESNQVWFRLNEKGARSVEYVSQAMFQSAIERDLKTEIKYMHFFERE